MIRLKDNLHGGKSMRNLRYPLLLALGLLLAACAPSQTVLSDGIPGGDILQGPQSTWLDAPFLSLLRVVGGEALHVGGALVVGPRQFRVEDLFVHVVEEFARVGEGRLHDAALPVGSLPDMEGFTTGPEVGRRDLVEPAVRGLRVRRVHPAKNVVERAVFEHQQHDVLDLARERK